MEWVEFTGKSVDEALDRALDQFETSSDQVDYEVIEKESNGLLGLFSRPAKIRVRLKEQEQEEEIVKPSAVQKVVETNPVVEEKVEEQPEEKIPAEPVDESLLVKTAEDFLSKVCDKMGIDAKFEISCVSEDCRIDINIVGNDMGLLIGKRGQTLDSLQYLTSLVVNKESGTYYKVKLDTENYRARRKETLENLARNISSKVKKTKKSVALEPMNPYERRIIHSALQNDKYVETYSEGEEPNRKVVVAMKKEYRNYNGNRGGYNKKYNRNYKKNNYNRGGYEKKNFQNKEETNEMEKATVPANSEE